MEGEGGMGGSPNHANSKFETENNTQKSFHLAHINIVQCCFLQTISRNSGRAIQHILAYFSLHHLESDIFLDSGTRELWAFCSAISSVICSPSTFISSCPVIQDIIKSWCSNIVLPCHEKGYCIEIKKGYWLGIILAGAQNCSGYTVKFICSHKCQRKPNLQGGLLHLDVFCKAGARFCI